jgi:hypothetical protein
VTLKLDSVAKTLLLRYVADRITTLHLALETDHDVAQTSTLRGQIREIRLLEAEIQAKTTLQKIPGAGIPIA